MKNLPLQEGRAETEQWGPLGARITAHLCMLRSQALPGGLSSWYSEEGPEAPRSERPAQAAQGEGRGEEHHLGQPQGPRPAHHTPPPGIRTFWKAALLPCPPGPPQGGEPGPLCVAAVKLAPSFCLSGNPWREKCASKGFVFLANQREDNKGRGGL